MFFVMINNPLRLEKEVSHHVVCELVEHPNASGSAGTGFQKSRYCMTDRSAAELPYRFVTAVVPHTASLQK